MLNFDVYSLSALSSMVILYSLLLSSLACTVKLEKAVSSLTIWQNALILFSLGTEFVRK